MQREIGPPHSDTRLTGYNGDVKVRHAAAALVLAAALPATAQARGTVSLIPASGPPGTVATLAGAGLPSRSRVVVRAGRRVVARRTTGARGDFRVTLTLQGATVITTTAGTRNHFRVGAPAGEAVTPEGARLRWTPLQATAGTPVHLSGAGLRPRRAVALSLGARALATARTPRGGRFASTLAAREGAGLARQGRARLPFAVRLLLREGTPTKGSPPNAPAPAPAPGTTSPAAPGELGFPIRAAFYYPWFPQAWDQSGI